jgi:hypothetical protein
MAFLSKFDGKRCFFDFDSLSFDKGRNKAPKEERRNGAVAIFQSARGCKARESIDKKEDGELR